MGDVAHAQLYRGALLLRKAAVVQPVHAGPAVPIGVRERPLLRWFPVKAQAARLQMPAWMFSHDVSDAGNFYLPADILQAAICMHLNVCFKLSESICRSWPSQL